MANNDEFKESSFLIDVGTVITLLAALLYTAGWAFASLLSTIVLYFMVKFCFQKAKKAMKKSLPNKEKIKFGNMIYFWQSVFCLRPL